MDTDDDDDDDDIENELISVGASITEPSAGGAENCLQTSRHFIFYAQLIVF